MKRRDSSIPGKIAIVLALGFALAAAAAAQDAWIAPDTSTISKFQDEATQHSHIMEVMGYLTDVYGPRLTNSPNIREAGEYAVKTLSAWGLANVHEET